VAVMVSPGAIAATDLDEAFAPIGVALPTEHGEHPGWERALAAWAGERLAAGADNLHALARERLDQILLEAALVHTHGHRGEAAQRLGLGRNTVTRKLGAGRRRR
jgi:two-component system, NtrC family, nitrogen regulation response regulator GlnG